VGTTSILEAALHAEHGLAYQIETVVNGESHSCLIDFATDAHGVMRNMKLLNINFGQIEALGLSHDHFDHQAAMIEILKAHVKAPREFRNSFGARFPDKNH
jgi:metal-dependent hydrolase (beta-lactamase superfamily II)